jgi:hypothetical protein
MIAIETPFFIAVLLYVSPINVPQNRRAELTA